MATATETVHEGVWTRLTTSALLLGLVHAFVDTASGFIIFRDVGSGRFDRAMVLTLVVLYNVLAFGGQTPAGLLADRFKIYRGLGALGAALAAAALFLSPYWTLAGVIVVGVGNAMFHVGAGAHVLKESSNRSTESGVFVGPGAVGLAAGIWLGGSDLPARGFIAALLLVGIPLLLRVARPSGTGQEPAPPKLPRVAAGAVVVVVACSACLVGSVTVRALVGGAVAGSWRGVSLMVMLGLAAAACLGKMLGGFVSDRIGWATTSVLALALAAPLVSYYVGTPTGAVLGMLLFQMTMPVTLKAMHHVMPSRPGLAFGIPCMALLAGALPGLFGLSLIGSWQVALATVGLSAVMVFAGLRLLVRSGASGGPGAELLLPSSRR